MKKFKEYLFITIGFIIVAIAAEFFLVPNNIAAGGVMGIAIVIYNFTSGIIPGLSVGFLMLIFNSILFVVAIIFIGGRFGAKTIYASLGLSGALWVFERFIPQGTAVTNDLLLATVFGTLISAIGMGIVFNQNASTGGTDILAKLLSKFVHLDIGKSLLIVDLVVTIFAGLTFGLEKGMYAILSVIALGFMIDIVIDGFNISRKVMIVSKNCEEIRSFIISELDRGCTIVEGIGGYSGEKTYILYIVLSRKEFIKLKTHIKNVAPDSFITVSDAHEVLGEGFKDIAHDF